MCEWVCVYESLSSSMQEDGQGLQLGVKNLSLNTGPVHFQLGAFK